jgi:hypothetical protein
MKIATFIMLFFASLNANAQQMDSLGREKNIESLRECSKKMAVPRGSSATVRNGRNIDVLNVSRKQLDSIILKLTDIMKNTKFEDITEQEHVSIIRFYNWVSLTSGYDYSANKSLLKLIDDSFYEWKLMCKYHWTISPGMGFHFIELEADLAGKMRTRFNVVD